MRYPTKLNPIQSIDGSNPCPTLPCHSVTLPHRYIRLVCNPHIQSKYDATNEVSLWHHIVQ